MAENMKGENNYVCAGESTKGSTSKAPRATPKSSKAVQNIKSAGKQGKSGYSYSGSSTGKTP